MTNIVKSCQPACAPNVALPLPGGTGAPVTPPVAAIPVVTETCAGVANRLADSRVEAIIPQGTVVYTKKCPTESEFDTLSLCDPNTGLPVFVVTSYSSTGLPSTTAYNIDGTPYGSPLSALVSCDTALESDPLEMCDSATQTSFIRWVVKKNGQPTGVVFDTTLLGVAYAAAGPVSVGSCLLATCGPETYLGVLTNWLPLQ